MSSIHNSIFKWSARILSVLAISFISMFAMDSFNSESSFADQLIAFTMHMIPSFILIIILILAWKRPLIGAVLYILLSIILSPIIFKHNFEMNHSVGKSAIVISIITLPFFIIGLLFIVDFYKRRKNDF